METENFIQALVSVEKWVSQTDLPVSSKLLVIQANEVIVTSHITTLN